MKTIHGTLSHEIGNILLFQIWFAFISASTTISLPIRDAKNIE